MVYYDEQRFSFFLQLQVFLSTLKVTLCSSPNRCKKSVYCEGEERAKVGVSCRRNSSRCSGVFACIFFLLSVCTTTVTDSADACSFAAAAAALSTTTTTNSNRRGRSQHFRVSSVTQLPLGRQQHHQQKQRRQRGDTTAVTGVLASDSEIARVEETPGPKHMLRMDTSPGAMWH